MIRTEKPRSKKIRSPRQKGGTCENSPRERSRSPDFVARRTALIDRRALWLTAFAVALFPPGAARAEAAERTKLGASSSARSRRRCRPRRPFEKDVTRILSNPTGRVPHLACAHAAQMLAGTVTPNKPPFSRSIIAGIPGHRSRQATGSLIHGMVRQPLRIQASKSSRAIRWSPACRFVECGRQFGADVLGTSRCRRRRRRFPRARSRCRVTGCRLPFCLDEAGIDPSAKWLIAEGADGQLLDRRVPVKKAYDDALVRPNLPERRASDARQRLSDAPAAARLPGQTLNVKFLRRLKAVDQAGH